MYAGKKVEEADARNCFSRRHCTLHATALRLDPTLAVIGGDTGVVTTAPERKSPGQVPALTNLPPGCSLRPRWRLPDDAGRFFLFRLRAEAPGHLAACWHSKKL